LTNLLVEEVHVAVDLNGNRGEAMYRCENWVRRHWGNATPCSAALLSKYLPDDAFVGIVRRLQLPQQHRVLHSTAQHNTVDSNETTVPMCGEEGRWATCAAASAPSAAVPAAGPPTGPLRARASSASEVAAACCQRADSSCAWEAGRWCGGAGRYQGR